MKCFICGRERKTQDHHIIPRSWQNEITKLKDETTIPLCHTCHLYMAPFIIKDTRAMYKNGQATGGYWKNRYGRARRMVKILNRKLDSKYTFSFVRNQQCGHAFIDVKTKK